MDIDNVLKVLFIIAAAIFLITLLSVPRTNCEACEIEYNGRIINGYEAFEIFEDECISYDSPWDQQDFAINLTGK